MFMNTNENLTGAVLHASKLLEGSFFEDAVILVAVHDENGAFGVMLNRPSHMPIHEVFNPVPEVRVAAHPFYVGGPVDEEGLHLLHLHNQIDSRNGLEVYPGVELGGEWDSIDEILLSDPARTFLFLGYSGWNSGQLEDEIAEGSWSVYQPNVRELLDQWEQNVRLDRDSMVRELTRTKKG